jgi:uncharacterized protein YjbI with pentapeptide repeats
VADPRSDGVAESRRYLTPELFEQLGSGHPPDALGLTKFDGLWDLRDYELARPRPGPVGEISGQRLIHGGAVTLDGVRIEGVDLRGADLAGLRIKGSSIVSSRFDDANLQMSVWKKVSVADTSFARADLREAVLGDGVRKSRFERVDFRKTRMANAGPSATFVDCDFSKALLTRVEYRDARLVRCRFAGPLLETVFYGKRTLRGHDERLDDVDFRDAQFHHVGFRTLNLTNVRLPTGDGHLVVEDPRCVLSRVLEAMGHQTDSEAVEWRARFEHELKWLGPNQAVGVFAVGDYETGQDGSNERIELVLRTAEAACRGDASRGATR